MSDRSFLGSLSAILGLVVCALTASCGVTPTAAWGRLKGQAQAGSDEPATLAFIDKAHRVLLHGAPLSPPALQKFRGKTRSRIVDELLADERFATTTLDFGYFFLGRPEMLNEILLRSRAPDGSPIEHLAGSAHPGWLRAPLQAALSVLAAQKKDARVPPQHEKELNTSSEYKTGLLALLERTGPLLAVAPLHPSAWDELSLQLQSLIDRQDYESGDASARADMLLNSVQNAFKHFTQGPEGADCEALALLPEAHHLVAALGDQDALLERVHGSAFVNYTRAKESCTTKEQPLDDAHRAAVSAFAQAWSAHSTLLRHLRERPATSFWASGVFDLSGALQTLDIQSSLSAQADDMNVFFRLHRNSSTNANRSRAAAILRTYFCDDLAPLSVVFSEPTPHGSDAHAADAGCRSCHARLDPLAGFFKNHGLTGIDFHSDPTFGGYLDLIRARFIADPLHEPLLIFDDLSLLKGEEVREYRSQWLPPRGVTAFIRSSVQPELNTSGEDLNDLFAIIGDAPEVRTCLAKRLLDYFVGPGQSWPRSTIDTLSKQLSSGADGVQSYKDAVKTIVLSATFAQEDPEPGVCYEEGANGATTLSCEIQSLLQKNCVGCHSASFQSGGLALDRQGRLSDGRWAFAHERQGCQVDPRETYQAIAESLVSAEASRRMPLLKHIEAHEREELLVWARAQATQPQGAETPVNQ